VTRRRFRSSAAAVLAAIGLGAGIVRWRRRRHAEHLRTSYSGRTVHLAGLGLQIGGAYASTAARKVFASAERKEALDRERELRTAEAVRDRLGGMKGALMKLGQMASYLDEGLPAPLRAALSELQSDAPPMSGELAAAVIERELGRRPDELFLEWDPVPIAAASVGQVHRALWLDPATGTERALAVKVQYPGVDEAIESDLRNAEFLGALLRQGFAGLDPDEMVAEIRERLVDELDYELEARNQALFADFYRGHPYISVPEVVPELSTRRVLASDLVDGQPWSEVLTWSQTERDLAAECIYRFVFRSLYQFHRFNGDPHPGNYLFHGGGRVTFLDFGLVKHFTDEEMATFEAMVRAGAYESDAAAYREAVERAGLLRHGAPVSTADVGEYFLHFYAPVRDDAVMTWTPEFASSIVRHTFDRSSPIAQYSTVPRAFVFIQRINLGLYALLGQLRATGNYRRISTEIWPFTRAAPTTPMGRAEASWLAAHHL
jgi:predicted unusual protein kinase regulating ubiquinone biosynthesis (AarF/ABC1/UbiB family)